VVCFIGGGKLQWYREITYNRKIQGPGWVNGLGSWIT
jgi:hypothetical protein